VNELAAKTDLQPIAAEPTVVTDVGLAAIAVLRLKESGDAVVPYLNYGAQKLGRAGIVGLSLVIFSLIAFVSGNVPLRQQVSEQAAELMQARQAAMADKIPATNQSPQAHAGRFVESLPGRRDIPQIMGSIVTIAAASGIELARGSYEYAAPDGDAIGHYRMALPINGSYPQVRMFVENLLAAEPSISLDNMRIERDSVSDQVIAADLRFSVLLEGTL
jgi:hypothetical protein